MSHLFIANQLAGWFHYFGCLIVVGRFSSDVGSHGVLIDLGSPFSLHSRSAGGIEIFRFCDSLNGYSIRPHPSPPPTLPQLYFPALATQDFAAFTPVANAKFTIGYLGYSSIFRVLTAIYYLICFAFFCRAVKAREAENFH